MRYRKPEKTGEDYPINGGTMIYYIRFDSVGISESGFVKTPEFCMLTLDSSYSDNVDFSMSDVKTYHSKEKKFEVDKQTFVRVLNNAKRYNKHLSEVCI